MQPKGATQSTDNTPLMHPKWSATKPFACYHLKEPITSRNVLELPPQLRCHSKEGMCTFNSLSGCSRLDRWFWRYEPNSEEHANMRTVLLLTVLTFPFKMMLDAEIDAVNARRASANTQPATSSVVEPAAPPDPVIAPAAAVRAQPAHRARKKKASRYH